jgi:hypothetical protein
MLNKPLKKASEKENLLSQTIGNSAFSTPRIPLEIEFADTTAEDASDRTVRAVEVIS